jgi:hypothetical protein
MAQKTVSIKRIRAALVGGVNRWALVCATKAKTVAKSPVKIMLFQTDMGIPDGNEDREEIAKGKLKRATTPICTVARHRPALKHHLG